MITAFGDLTDSSWDVFPNTDEKRNPWLAMEFVTLMARDLDVPMTVIHMMESERMVWA